MSVALPILANDRYAVSTATEGQVDFAIDYPFQFASDILVTRTRAEVETVLLLGDDYSIVGENEPAGGTLTLTAGAEAGDVIRRIGSAAHERTSNMTAAGKFRSQLIERDLDRLTIIAQEVNRDRQRAIKVALGQTAGEVVPGAAGTLAVWAEDGGLVEGLPAGPYDAALQELNLTKVAKAGDTMTGDLVVPRLGINAVPDATNPLSATINKALFAARTAANGGDGDIRHTLSKETAGDLASLLFQTNFSGRAELGLIGNDDLTLKVSPDGSSWYHGFVMNKDDGRIAFPHTPVIMGALGGNDNRLVRADGAGGLTAQGSTITVDDSGNMSGVGTLAAGATTLSGLLTTNGQIAFTGTLNPSADPNTLDAYREGTFTPAFSATGSTFSYAIQSGTFIRIGRLVQFEIAIALNTSGNTLTGNALSITGLPFAAASTAAAQPVRWQNSTTSFISVTSRVAGTSVVLEALTAASTGPGVANANTLLHATNGSTLWMVGTYIV